MRPSSSSGLKRAELLSAVGAGVLGAGIALMLVDILAPYAVPILVLGLAAHAVGMLQKHRLERQADAARIWWAEVLYWLCWLGLAAVVIVVLIGRS